MNISSRRRQPQRKKIEFSIKRDANYGDKEVITPSHNPPENGWFAARPSGTEDIYKIYTESFKNKAHLQRIQQEAQTIVSAAFQVAGV
ncbi:hypothetical protein [uncultured Desulfobacter sp.]|uniref:hypothetical protein n=1 Tax=uncultured Desulfobacter sp. TaxID=240139 RepID=UPI0029C76DF5|nr:hypothetical protein [uncultured Desulfobacter sp.]